MFTFKENNVAEWTSTNGKWIVFAHAIADTMADGQVIGYNSRVTVVPG